MFRKMTMPIIAALCLGPFNAASAQEDIESCEQYAYLMVLMMDAAKDIGCSAITDRWGDNYGEHFNYCQRVTLPSAIETREALKPTFQQCSHRRVIAVCEAYKLTMSTLQGRMIALCPRGQLGGYTTSTDIEFQQDCLMHSFGRQDWYLERVNSMQARIDACR